jgi:dolichol-phosphate mannosyltransferase
VLAVASPDDTVVVMDADDTHDVGLIPKLRALLEAGADIAIASRFVGGGSDATAPLYRRLLSRGASLTLRLALPGNRTSDFSSGYRAYRVRLLQQAATFWGDSLIEEKGFACMVELLLKLLPLNPVIAEEPLFLRYDLKRSPSKLRIARTVLEYLRMAVRGRSWVKQRATTGT